MAKPGPETQSLITSMLTLAGLMAVVALGIQIVVVVRRRITARSEDDHEELAESFRQAYEAGEIDSDEYRRIKASLDRAAIPPLPRPEPSPSSPPASEPAPEGSSDDHPEPAGDAAEPSDDDAEGKPGPSPEPG